MAKTGEQIEKKVILTTNHYLAKDYYLIVYYITSVTCLYLSIYLSFYLYSLL